MSDQGLTAAVDFWCPASEILKRCAAEVALAAEKRTSSSPQLPIRSPSKHRLQSKSNDNKQVSTIVLIVALLISKFKHASVFDVYAFYHYPRLLFGVKIAMQ